MVFGPVVFVAVYQLLAAATRGGGIVEMRQKTSAFHVTQKQKSCHQYEGPVIQVMIVEPFHHTSKLRHIFERAIGGGAVPSVIFGWLMHTVCHQITMHQARMKDTKKYI